MIDMKDVNELFDIVDYCRSLDLFDVELFINGAGKMYLTINDTYPDVFVYEIGNIGEKAWAVRNGFETPSYIIEIKQKLQKIALDISKEMCYS